MATRIALRSRSGYGHAFGGVPRPVLRLVRSGYADPFIGHALYQ